MTADTLEALAHHDRELFLILGADAVANMGTWRRLDDTRHLATVVVVERRGDVHAEPPGRGLEGRPGRRSRASTSRRPTCASGLPRGRPIDGLVPPAVVRAIRDRGLYTGGR